MRLEVERRDGQGLPECDNEEQLLQCIGKVWKMSEYGTAQGTPCSPPYANLYLAHLEKELLALAPHLWPILFKRFLDDGFAIFQTKEMAEQWTMLYDSLRPKIKLKVEMS
jgi:hypothetical protein